MDLDFCWMDGFANCIPTLGENDQYTPVNFHQWAIMFTCDLLWLTNEAVTLLGELIFAFTGRNEIVSMKDGWSL
jgi:hypothetical protein